MNTQVEQLNHRGMVSSIWCIGLLPPIHAVRHRALQQHLPRLLVISLQDWTKVCNPYGWDFCNHEAKLAKIRVMRSGYL